VLSPGDKLKDYEVVAPIRSGGMAMLYLARRRGVGGFSRLVALKLVHAHLTDDPDINRLFLQEARIAASVAHPNVVHVEEVGSVDGKYFIAMEYVHGVSLDELLISLAKRRMRMSPKLCVWVAAQVSEALHAVHEATWENGTPLNIVHRDVSPQNVLVSHDGHIKLIDFGIAKSQLMGHQASSRGSVIGKLRYMAPEQLRTQPVSRRTDVYALGVMLWEMLASRNLLRCFRIDDERDWLTREKPPCPSTHAAGVSAAIDQAVLRALACEPTHRYENALLFRSALLRAEPSASRVDAPQFAALLHDVLGEELARRRANWPREVSVQLDSDVVSDTDRSLNLEELTARLRPAEVADESDDGDDSEEPTFPEFDAADEKTVLQRPLSSSERPAPRQPSVQAQIPTIAAPPSTAQPRTAWSQTLRALARRTSRPRTALGALLVALLAYGVASSRRGYPNVANDAAPAPRVAAQLVSVPDASARLRLGETQIAAATHDNTKRMAPRAHPPSAPGEKRFLGAGKGGRKKGKGAMIARAKKARHP
jgi:serine/threonine protein kinase